MRLVDELFELYRDQLTGDEEDLDAITAAVIENYNRKDLLTIVNDMSNAELEHFIGLYILETLKNKFADYASYDAYPSTKYLQ
ncbi:DUF6154 family protein [Heyndrickxia acidiproducens]|jgi:hypothetical protein|uniref:DUF6154 family protein n=1 Tax=Heyndrickxia acidiproducens TaxID=1121084 RepID=UPI000364D847|nr:DUF6154 family protein [Heyndrickxia acidiproducens]